MKLSHILVYIACLTYLSVLCAQELAYTSGPTRLYTFSSEPSPSLMFNGTEFEWTASRGQHSGLAYLDGVNDSVNLWSYPDDNNQYFPAYIGQRSFSICVWAQFLDIQTYSRLFETSAVYGAGDNICIMAVGDGGGLGFRMYSSGTRYGTDVSRAITPNTWLHVCMVGDQIILNDTTSNSAANYTGYINARPVTTFTGPLPRNVFRGIANIGKSSFINSADNLFFRGWVDSLAWYNYQLQDQQIAAHYVCKRPPVFDIAFAENPAQISGITATTYGFILVDQADIDAGLSSYRKGLLTFNGTNDYVDLTTSSGGSSIGTTLPTIGGDGFGTMPSSSYNGYDLGWTFECLVKFKQIGNNAKVYHFSDGGANDIFLGFSGSTNTLMFSASANSVASSIEVVQNTPTNIWMHIIVTLTRTTSRGVTTNHLNVYVDGTLRRSAIATSWPTYVARSTAYLARSASSSDAYLGMYLDSMRIFDFAIDNATASNLYITTNSPLPTPIVNATRDDMYSTSPVVIYGFDNPSYSNFSNFAWSESAGSINGIASFSGNWNQFVDLSTFPDDYSRMIPAVFGGEMSLEFHIQVYSLNWWSRVFDFGGTLAREDNNVYFATFESSSDMILNLFSGTLSQRTFVRQGWTPGRWQHVVATIKQVDFANPASATAAQTNIYIDGVLRGQGLGYLPSVVARPNVFLAKSNWQADARFQGAFDFFALYQYPLSASQVAAHACVNEPPEFETAFNSDPRTLMSSSPDGYTYTYLDVDPTGSGTFQHTGILAFTPSASQFVDLAMYQFPSGIGTKLPMLGGTGSGFGSQMGWTFEVQVLFRSTSIGGVFDFGAGTSDRIRLGAYGDTSVLQFIVSNPVEQTSVNVIDSITVNHWYHILVVVTPSVNDSSSTSGTYSVYIDGQIKPLASTSGSYPRAVNRTTALLGRSQEGTYSDMLLDTLRIYDYAVTEDMCSCLYRAANNIPPEAIQEPVYLTQPTNLWGFESSYPDTSQAFYQHQNNVGGRNGVAYFNGAQSFANLGTYPDSYGTTLSTTFGGELTFQAWVQFTSVTPDARFFEFSNGADVNSLRLVATDPLGLSLTIFGDDGLQGTTFQLDNAIPALNTWFHLSITIAKSSSTVPQASANAKFYINAVLQNTFTMQLPRIVERGTLFLGRGMATTAPKFNGYIDSFAMYDYPLQPESLKVHYMSARLPVFELDFALDPRPVVNLTATTAGYSWVQYIAEEGSSALHQGVLVLNRATSQYINLRQTSGTRSLGVLVPDVGGQFGRSLDWSSGFTLQLTFKVRTQSDASLVLLRNGADERGDQISISLTNGGNTLQVVASESRTQIVSKLDAYHSIQAGIWYHVVIVMAPTNYQFTRSFWAVFVNGGEVAAADNMVYPQKVSRQVARLGGNSASDAFDGYIDSLRIFDHQVSAATIQNMYALQADLDALGKFNLGCTRYGPVPGGSILAAFLIQVDISQLDNTFGSKIESALSSALHIFSSAVACQSAVGSDNRMSLAAGPVAGQTEVRVYLYRTGPINSKSAENAYQLLGSKIDDGSLNADLASHGLPYTAVPKSLSPKQECSDFQVRDSCDSSSGLSSGAIAGIVIGSVVGAILLLIAGICFLRSRASSPKKYGEKKTWESHKDLENATSEEDSESGEVEMH